MKFRKNLFNFSSCFFFTVLSWTIIRTSYLWKQLFVRETKIEATVENGVLLIQSSSLDSASLSQWSRWSTLREKKDESWRKRRERGKYNVKVGVLTKRLSPYIFALIQLDLFSKTFKYFIIDNCMVFMSLYLHRAYIKRYNNFVIYIIARYVSTLKFLRAISFIWESILVE